MLKFLSKVYVEFNGLDPRISCCLEFWRQCQSTKAYESNPNCEVIMKRRTDDHPPQITLTFTNGAVEAIDATSTHAHALRDFVCEKGEAIEREQMFRDNGLSWPVIIPEDELNRRYRGVKPRNVPSKQY